MANRAGIGGRLHDVRSAIGSEHQVAPYEVGTTGVATAELVHPDRQGGPVELHLEHVMGPAPLVEPLVVHRR